MWWWISVHSSIPNWQESYSMRLSKVLGMLFIQASFCAHQGCTRVVFWVHLSNDPLNSNLSCYYSPTSIQRTDIIPAPFCTNLKDPRRSAVSKKFKPQSKSHRSIFYQHFLICFLLFLMQFNAFHCCHMTWQLNNYMNDQVHRCS